LQSLARGPGQSKTRQELFHQHKRALRNTKARLRLFEQFVIAQMKKDRIPGLTIGFTKDDFTWVKGFGYADLENKVPAKPESAYRLASVTKTMTGTAIVQLVERGKINLDEEIQTYLPYYPKQKWPVTVRQLLVHLGGGQTGSGIGPVYVSPREVVARIADFPIKNEPGVKFDYQTSGYNLLGAAIEEVTGKSFGAYLEENIWLPVGMKNTRMDSVRDLIPNRVRGYELVKDEIRNASYLDVSSRFGGGGANGTVPDLLRWASGLERSGILSKASLDLMFTPVANKSGHYVGIEGDVWYYALGWQVFPVNGQFVFYNDGGQIGTNTMMLRIPSENLSIAFACNLQEIDRWPYIKRLYNAVTDQSWDVSVYTRDKTDAAVYKGMSDTFNYGSLYYDQLKRPETTDTQVLAKAFVYFNKNVSRSSLGAAFQETVTAIKDGRHPIADTAFIKVGSYMAMKLREKFGTGRTSSYHTMGAIPFFADYVEMYKASPGFPKELRFSEPFEEIVGKWNRDWTRTWTDYTRHFVNASGASDLNRDLNTLESSFTKLFAGAEVYPNLMGRLLEIRQSYEPQKDWLKAAQAAKIAAELYPQSDATNTYYAISLIIVGKTNEARASLKKASGINANGIASARALNQIALALSGINSNAAVEWLKLAVEIYPREAVLYGTLGDFYLKQELRQRATEAYKKAVEVDPNYVHAKEALKKLME
jgi:CubicO group peptidase (beta-lactamase class C family)